MTNLQKPDLSKDSVKTPLTDDEVCFRLGGVIAGLHAMAKNEGQPMIAEAAELVEDARQRLLAMARQSQGSGEAVAWRYRYVDADGRPRGWTLRQTPITSRPAEPFCAAIEAQPLYTAPPPAETNPYWEAFNGRSPMPGPAEIGGTVGHLAASYELTKQIGRMTHSGDEDWLDDADDNRATIDGLIAKARDIMAMPSTAQGGGATVEEIARVEQHIGWLNTRAELLGLMDEPGDKENATYFRQIAKDLSRLSTGGSGREVVEAAKALIKAHEDTAGIDFVGWCQMVSAKVDRLRAALKAAGGK